MRSPMNYARFSVLLAAVALSACASVEPGGGLEPTDTPANWDAPIPTDAST